MAVPGCPLPDFSTASMARARTVLTARRSRSDHSSSCGVWAFTACRLLLGHPFARWVGWSCACVSGPSPCCRTRAGAVRVTRYAVEEGGAPAPPSAGQVSCRTASLGTTAAEVGENHDGSGQSRAYRPRSVVSWPDTSVHWPVGWPARRLSPVAAAERGAWHAGGGLGGVRPCCTPRSRPARTAFLVDGGLVLGPRVEVLQYVVDGVSAGPGNVSAVRPRVASSVENP